MALRKHESTIIDGYELTYTEYTYGRTLRTIPTTPTSDEPLRIMHFTPSMWRWVMSFQSPPIVEPELVELRNGALNVLTNESEVERRIQDMIKSMSAVPAESRNVPTMSVANVLTLLNNLLIVRKPQ